MKIKSWENHSFEFPFNYSMNLDQQGQGLLNHQYSTLNNTDNEIRDEDLEFCFA